MLTQEKKSIFIASLFMAIAIILGAFGSHVLKPRMSFSELSVFETGVTYQFYHSLGLFVTVLIGRYYPSPWVARSRLAMMGGMLLFCGSLYLLSLTGIKWMGAIAPVGGILLVSAWLFLAIGLIGRKDKI